MKSAIATCADCGIELLNPYFIDHFHGGSCSIAWKTTVDEEPSKKVEHRQKTETPKRYYWRPDPKYHWTKDRIAWQQIMWGAEEMNRISHSSFEDFEDVFEYIIRNAS